MAKRPHTDSEVAEDLSQSHNISGNKLKKRKAKELDGTNGQDATSKPSREERRELKRLRKLGKETESEERGANGIANGEISQTAEVSAEKAARDTERARLKSIKNDVAREKENGFNPDQDVPAGKKEQLLNGDGNHESDKAAAKAARKAEKKRLKSIQKSTLQEGKDASTLDQEGGGPEQNGLPAEHEEEVADKAAAKAQKAEKKRLRALGNIEGQKQNGGLKVSEDGRSDVPRGTKPISNTNRDLSLNYTQNASLTILPQSEINSFLSDQFITINDPSTATSLRPIMSFSHLPKPTDTSPFATFKSPTPVQSAAWPFLLSGRDLIGVAETGSGKTLAFGVPCIRALTVLPQPKKSHGPVARAVMVSPTRELAVQIHDQIVALAMPAGLKSVCVYGGVPKPPQVAALRTAHIIIATPGRLNDLISEGSADLSGIGYLVLDEADRMLDKGFEDAIRNIISCCPSTSMGRQTAMFTATWPPSVRDLASTFMKDPVHISIGDNEGGELRANARIEQRVEVVDPRGKEQRLLQIIKQHQSGKNKDDRILVFCLYKKEATRVEGFLRSKGLRVAGIHGDLSQENRSKSLESFKSGACPLLVATDVAARGLDIPSVKLVVNCTFPLTVEDYVHRIGRYVSLASCHFPVLKLFTNTTCRTGRAGKQGLAITLFTEHDKAQSGALINVLKAAGQPVPEDLLKFGTTVKKKAHEAYGAFYRDTGAEGKKATKIVF